LSQEKLRERRKANMSCRERLSLSLQLIFMERLPAGTVPVWGEDSGVVLVVADRLNTLQSRKTLLTSLLFDKAWQGLWFSACFSRFWGFSHPYFVKFLQKLWGFGNFVVYFRFRRFFAVFRVKKPSKTNLQRN
jgi:hypothetical protein